MSMALVTEAQFAFAQAKPWQELVNFCCFQSTHAFPIHKHSLIKKNAIDMKNSQLLGAGYPSWNAELVIVLHLMC